MLYLLYGSDSYRRLQRLRELERQYCEKNPQALGVTALDESADAESIIRALVSSGGLFEEKRFVILRDSLAAHGDELFAIFERTRAAQRDDLNAVLVEDDIAKGKTLKRLSDLCRFTEEFSPLAPEDLERWIFAYAKKRATPEGPYTIERAAAKELARLGNDLWRLSSELEKLLVFCVGEKTIARADVLRLVVFSHEETVFPLSDGICERNLEGALAALARLTAKEENIDGLVGYVIREARHLARARLWIEEPIKSPEKVFDVNPFVWKRRVNQARAWRVDEARQLISDALTLERSWKTGGEKRLALERLILSASR